MTTKHVQYRKKGISVLLTAVINHLTTVAGNLGLPRVFAVAFIFCKSNIQSRFIIKQDE